MSRLSAFPLTSLQVKTELMRQSLEFSPTMCEPLANRHFKSKLGTICTLGYRTSASGSLPRRRINHRQASRLGIQIQINFTDVSGCQSLSELRNGPRAEEIKL